MKTKKKSRIVSFESKTSAATQLNRIFKNLSLSSNQFLNCLPFCSRMQNKAHKNINDVSFSIRLRITHRTIAIGATVEMCAVLVPLAKLLTVKTNQQNYVISASRVEAFSTNDSFRTSIISK